MTICQNVHFLVCQKENPKMIIQLSYVLNIILFQFCAKFASVGIFQNGLTYSTPFIIWVNDYIFYLCFTYQSF